MLYWINLTLPTPEENLALDQALLRAVDRAVASGGDPSEMLRFWESPVPVVVLGSTSKLCEDVDVEACSAERIPILRRASGGGAVLLGPGCLNFALVLSLEKHPEYRDVRRSYRGILGAMVKALDLNGLAICGTSDVVFDDRKISGNAQKRTRYALLHHGTILYDFDTGLMRRVLVEPARQPPYRQRRSHEVFVGNIPLCASEVKSRLAKAWCADPAGAGSSCRAPWKASLRYQDTSQPSAHLTARSGSRGGSAWGFSGPWSRRR